MIHIPENIHLKLNSLNIINQVISFSSHDPTCTNDPILKSTELDLYLEKSQLSTSKNYLCIACENQLNCEFSISFSEEKKGFKLEENDNLTLKSSLEEWEDDDNIVLKARKDGKYLIGNIGRISEQKGMEYFIKAVPDVLSVHPDTEFFVIGSGEDEERIKDMAKDLPVTFLGYRTDIQNLMSQMDLIVLSSLWEGLPLTPIEAFSVGKTIVATGVDGTVEIVEDGVSGLIVPPRDPKAIAEKINYMIDNPEDKKQMEEKAVERYEEEFSFDTLAGSYIDYYRSL